MSLISGSYSRVLGTMGTLLLREVMVEKGAAAALLVAMGLVGVVRRAMGRTALPMTLDRWRRVLEAVLHRLRLKADMVRLALPWPDNVNASSS